MNSRRTRQQNLVLRVVLLERKLRQTSAALEWIKLRAQMEDVTPFVQKIIAVAEEGLSACGEIAKGTIVSKVRIVKCSFPGGWWEKFIGQEVKVFATDQYGHWTRDTGPMEHSQWIPVEDSELTDFR